jgi:hypothetical protein
MTGLSVSRSTILCRVIVVSCHSPDRFHTEKGGRVATERNEFLRAAWRVMVAAAVEPDRLLFVDECGTYTSLGPIYAYAPRGERL